MTASPKKRRANRANAQRSTGPKSAIGRRIASQNARDHGLSVALNPTIIAPQVSRIATMIHEDGISNIQANEIAEKILDYERNLQHERETFSRKFLGVALSEVSDEGAEQLALYNAYFSTSESASVRGLDAQERTEQRAFRAFARFMQRTLRKQAKKDAIASVRYNKRSSNQLIKALKRSAA